MTLHVGEDLFSNVIAVSLLSLFITALVHSYHLYSLRQKDFDDFDLALDVAERLRGSILAVGDGLPGLIEISQCRLENFAKILAVQRIKMRVEIRTLDGKLLQYSGPGPDALSCYLSPATNVSLPVAVVCDNRGAKLCELVVHVWRD